MNKTSQSSSRPKNQTPQRTRLNPSDLQAQLAAMSEIMGVINASRDDEAPIFAAILENAQSLCNAPMAGLILATPEDEYQTLAAHVGMFDAAVEMFASGQMKVDPNLSYAAKSIVEGKLIAWPDMGESDLYHAGSPVVRAMVDESSIRSVLFVPLIQGKRAIGNITLFRREVDPFSQNEIELVQAFAAQAVVALDNAQQFRALQTRLQREAATRKVLQGISQSREDEQPVFDLIVELAKDLCDATFAGLVLGRKGDARQRLVACVNLPPEVQQLWTDGKYTMEPGGSIVGDAILKGEIITVKDMAETHFHAAGDERYRLIVDENDVRSNLFVPLLVDGEGIGCLMLARNEVRPYTEDQIVLVETFAEQAVIAIENVRQFREMQERLEREAATKQILSMISQSRDDETPVFESILAQAERLCRADGSGLQLLNEAETHLRIAAIGAWDAKNSFPIGSEFDLSAPLAMSTAVREARVVHIEDLKDTELYRQGHEGRRKLVDEAGVRTHLCVPLVKDGRAFGNITLSRRNQRAFSSDEIALVESFAAQAVIAIENTRQFKATQDALARQTATSEILRVINASGTELQPVFDLVNQKAAEFCGAPYSIMWHYDGQLNHFISHHGFTQEEMDKFSAVTPPRPAASTQP